MRLDSGSSTREPGSLTGPCANADSYFTPAKIAQEIELHRARLDAALAGFDGVDQREVRAAAAGIGILHQLFPSNSSVRWDIAHRGSIPTSNAFDEWINRIRQTSLKSETA